uniref:Protein kinase domain-containing protein n=1 Tax=Rhabditophanes sp. KR3021 TaxID=114890 RepID=A0AC35TM60_9BILA
MELSEGTELFTKPIIEAISYIKQDPLDIWPIKGRFYRTNEVKCSKTSRSTTVTASTPFPGQNQNTDRLCVIKVNHLSRKVEALLKAFTKDQSLLKTKINHISSEIVLSLIVLNKFRHLNLMHAHATWFSNETNDIKIVMPFLYCLKDLINLHREKMDNEPLPMVIIGPIIRQVCNGLTYIHNNYVIHRDICSANIFLTRGGTVKVGGFQSAKTIASPGALSTCKSPKGEKQFMCSKKQLNLNTISEIDAVPYETSSDIWSVGVLIVQMISFYPNEKFHKLPENFAVIMLEQRKSFEAYLEDHLQLKMRIGKSGGRVLELALSERILTIYEDERITAKGLVQLLIDKKWASADVKKDRRLLVADFIKILDFTNKKHFGSFGPNYDVYKDEYGLFESNGAKERNLQLDKIILHVAIQVNEETMGSVNISIRDHSVLWKLLFENAENKHITMLDALKIYDLNVKVIVELLQFGSKNFDYSKQPTNCRQIDISEGRNVTITTILDLS